MRSRSPLLSRSPLPSRSLLPNRWRAPSLRRIGLGYGHAGLLRHLPERKMALDVFTVIEDSRLDARVLREYRGISRAYRRLQQESLDERPRITEMPAQQGLIEFLIRVSLGQRSELPVATYLAEDAMLMAKLALRVMRVGATVETRPRRPSALPLHRRHPQPLHPRQRVDVRGSARRGRLRGPGEHRGPPVAARKAGAGTGRAGGRGPGAAAVPVATGRRVPPASSSRN